MSDDRQTNERESGFPGMPGTGSLAPLRNTQKIYTNTQLYKYKNT